MIFWIGEFKGIRFYESLLPARPHGTEGAQLSNPSGDNVSGEGTLLRPPRAPPTSPLPVDWHCVQRTYPTTGRSGHRHGRASTGSG